MNTFAKYQKVGFTLIEVTLALGVAGFCLTTLFGLLPVALNSNRAAIEQTAANSILSAVISDLRATPSSLPRGTAVSSQQYAIDIPASGVAGSNTLYFNSERQKVASASTGRYLVSISFLAPPSGSGPKTAAMAAIRVAWPASASIANAAGSVETFTALDRN
ncbi:MAG: hypothetical protein ABIT76_09670 [Chthoniobacterales bacterium]